MIRKAGKILLMRSGTCAAQNGGANTRKIPKNIRYMLADLLSKIRMGLWLQENKRNIPSV
jgi:hypothetical protein